MKTRHRFSLSALLILLISVPSLSIAQQNEVISGEKPEPVEKREDVLILINDEPTALTDVFEVGRNEKIEFSVRYLKPASPVRLHLKKGKIKMKSYLFTANRKGELDLEINTGHRKVKGVGIIEYTPSGGKKREHEVKVFVR